MIEQVIRRLETIRKEADQAQLLLERIDENIAASSLHHIEHLLQDYHNQLTEFLSARTPLAETNNPPTNPPTAFRMDPDARAARAGRRRIPLTEMEFNLLEFLWEQAPRPVSRDSLLEHLYADVPKPSEQVIDVFIFRIRQKLSSAGVTDATIENVKGSGWSLEVQS